MFGKKRKKDIQEKEERIAQLEEILCPNGHYFVKVDSHLEGGSGRGDEITIYHYVCKRCKKEVQSSKMWGISSNKIKIKYEKYYNDSKKNYYEKEFSSLAQLEEWIFQQIEQIKQNYSYPDFLICFPDLNSQNKTINITLIKDSPSIWIHQIENEQGILLSDGKYTAGRNHMSNQVKEWCSHCRKRLIASPSETQFKFVD